MNQSVEPHPECDRCASFTSTCVLCETATRLQRVCSCVILGNYVVAAPGDNPHVLYARYVAQGWRRWVYGHPQ